jgi:hypothetical protein
MPEETESAYFLTVEWCRNGARGILCNNGGQCFRKDEPHTVLEMHEILGPFWIIFDPKSELFDKDQVSELNYWVPLEEYSDQFGIALRIPTTLGKIQ